MNYSNRKKLFRVMNHASSMNSQLRGQLRFLNEYFEITAVSTGQEYLEEIKKREGIRVINIPMERSISLVQDIKSLYKFIILFKKEKPDIVHASTPKGSLLAILAAFICRVPRRIYTVTGLRFETTKGFLRKILILMEKLTSFCATEVIPEGEGVKQTLLKYNITTKPLEVILNGNVNGVDIDYFNKESIRKTKEQLREQLSIPSHHLVFIFVGRVVKDKGVNELLTSFDKLSKLFSISLIILGNLEDKLDPILDSSKAILKNNPFVLFEGYKKDIRPYLKASDCIVLPSYREGFPNVLLQAGAMGLPAITTNISGCNEIIQNGSTGIIIPKEDEKALEEAMSLLIKNFDMIIKMSNTIRPIIEEKFEQSKVWNALLNHLNK